MIAADDPASRRRLDERPGVGKTTVWRWRIRILAALERAARPLGGVVEAHQTTRRESGEGSREWVRHAHGPEKHPKPPRPTSRDWRRPGLPPPLGHSPWRIPVLALAERAEDRRAERVKDHNAPSLHAALDPALRRDAVLCSHGDGAFAAFARARGATRYAIPARRGAQVVADALHIQTGNNLHAVLKDFLRPFRGPATRHLDGYLTWFLARQRRKDPWLAMVAE